MTGDEKQNLKACHALDEAFVQILKGMNAGVVGVAEQASSCILRAAEQFLTKRAQDAVRNFHALYFGSTGVEESKAAVNKDVDDMIEQLRREIGAGVDESKLGHSVNEKESLRGMRLGLSGIQKELEAIIHLESGIRDKLMPVLWSMQFEDMIRHRLGNVSAMWEKIITSLRTDGTLNPATVGEEIASTLSSTSERELFFRLVLKREPPAGAEEETSILFELT